MSHKYGGDHVGLLGPAAGWPGKHFYGSVRPGFEGRHRYGGEPAGNQGSHYYGSGRLGVTGAEIRANTATGPHGPGLFYNDWQSAADDATEFAGRMVQWPATGTFLPNEDGSYDLLNPADGTWPLSYHLYTFDAAGMHDKGVADGQIVVGASAVLIGASGAVVTNFSSTIAANIQLSANSAAISASGAVVTNFSSTIAAQIEIAEANLPVLIEAAGAVVTNFSSVIHGLALIGLPGTALLQPSKRVIPVGTRQTPIKLNRLDVDDVDDVAFRCGPALLPGEYIVDAQITSEARVGDDPNAGNLLVGSWQISGSYVLQRIQGPVAGVTYLLRGLITLSSGRQIVGAAFVPVARML